MSFVVVRQAENHAHGAMVFDAPDEWTVTFEGDPYIEGRCLTEEGNGSWFIIDPDTNQWATLLRRDDSPYNDCLPPSETLLSDAFRQETTVEKRLKSIARSADGGFYNPFNILIGSAESNKTVLLEQSFQSSTRTLEDGVHILADHDQLNQPSASFLQEINDVPSREALETMFSDLHTPDGLREPAMIVEFSHGDNGWELSYFSREPESDGWTTLTPNKE